MRIHHYATGLDADEAMEGYNAWCLAHYDVSIWLKRNSIY